MKRVFFFALILGGIQSQAALSLGRIYDDKYLISIVESSEALSSVKAAYGNCGSAQVKGDKGMNYINSKTVIYRCHGKKDGSVIVKATTSVTTWGETTNIKVEVINIKGVSN